jgi:hypothetical protein
LKPKPLLISLQLLQNKDYVGGNSTLIVDFDSNQEVENVKIGDLLIYSDCMLLARATYRANHEDLFTHEEEMESFFPNMTVSDVKKLFTN